jgi:hypothetical protein
MLDPANGEETWVAESAGRLQGSISFLKPGGRPGNPVANLGRNLIRPEAWPTVRRKPLARRQQDRHGTRRNGHRPHCRQ